MARVVWRQTALDDLARCWTQANHAERQAITAASHLIDQRLALDPANEGESRPDGSRITFAFPLTIRFSVSADRRIVSVLYVHLFRHRRQ